MANLSDEPPGGPYPRTYHTPRADATYEQCPWEEQHVLAIYPILNGHLQADGEWHDIPVELPSRGRYRIYGGYFQAVYANADSAVFAALLRMDPMEVEDDGEWELWRIDTDEGDCYAVSSTFALTPGPFAYHSGAEEWLERHGLGFHRADFHVEGVAYFEEIEPRCLRDAVQRLAWLELAIADLNQRLEAAGEQFWEELRPESDTIMEEQDSSPNSREIVPLLARYWAGSPKRRLALSEMKDAARHDPDPTGPAPAASE